MVDNRWTNPQWTRRRFTQTLGLSAAAALLPRHARATPQPKLAFVAAGPSPAHRLGAIHVFATSGSAWQRLQTLPAEAPAHLEPHPTLPILYAVHAVDLWQGLPRGAVSAFRIAASGHLTPHSAQPLSLSATGPGSAALSPDGRHLVVAAERGGIYNLLPLAPDGSLQPPSAIRKEFGRGEGDDATPASPRSVLFHPQTSTLLSADPGRQALALFAIDPAAISLRHRIPTRTAASPAQIALSPFSPWVYLLDAHNASIAAHYLVPSARLTTPQHILASPQPGPALLAMHPSGRFLLLATDSALSVLAIHPATGRLSPLRTHRLHEPLQTLAFSGAHLLGITQTSSRILQIPFNPTSATLGTPRPVAHVPSAQHLLLRPA